MRFTQHAMAVISIQRKGIEHTRPAQRNACARRATKVESLADVTCGIRTNEIEGRSPKGLRDHLIQSQAKSASRKSASRKAATDNPGRDSTALDNKTTWMTPAAIVLERQPTITGAKAGRRNERERRAWNGSSTSQRTSVAGQERPGLSVPKPWTGAAQGTEAEGRARGPGTACWRRGGGMEPGDDEGVRQTERGERTQNGRRRKRSRAGDM
ncbi:hypothetical protein Q7P35_008238 [Cladosporium inversicolor]